MPTKIEIAPEFRRKYTLLFLQPIGRLLFILVCSPIIALPRHHPPHETLSYGLLHDAFTPANIGHTTVALSVWCVVGLLWTIMNAMRSYALGQQLRNASLVLQQAVPKDVTAKCWRRQNDNSGVWRVSIYDKRASADASESVCNAIAFHGTLAETPAPQPARLYRLETIPQVQVVRLPDGATIALAPQQLPAPTPASAPSGLPAGTSVAASSGQGTIEPEFRGALISGYGVTLFFSVLIFFAYYGSLHSKLPGFVFSTVAFTAITICCVVICELLRTRLRQATMALRQAVPQNVLVKCWKLSGGKHWHISFIDQTLPPSLSQRQFLAIGSSGGKLHDSDEPQPAALYLLEAYPDTLVLQFADGARAVVMPNGTLARLLS